jgi:hypothetical protein
MRLYHTTTIAKADVIMAEGFLDHATLNKRLTATYRYDPGVWFSDVPAIDDELFDGVGLFDFDAERQAFIAVDLDLPCADIVSSDCDGTWPGTQYRGKAAVWNRFPRTRLTLDEIIRLRLNAMDSSARRDIKEWAAKNRKYGVEFATRVRTAIAETRL